ncbi:unnamed protein product [Rotaria sp. Silwood1]|nr:unnamed protein product [Rotaria sp. Silwood1]CAF1315546.1 unnamed protein product [Rotaria sp. Silwood1]CAF3461801.1 unnamed protein product [Rotaria sp. Silwood1]CAF3488550.1 unnamed protein product [Rotaria sp. Silwood1]CAF3503353.1 unnamed protein product [Rotaria sp. Silwood1]
MSHTSSTTHPSTQTHASNPAHPTGLSHKNTVEQFADAVNGNHLNNLDKYLDANVQKTIDSQVIYKDLKEARDYYTKEHTNKKTAHWKIINFHDDDQKGNTSRARLNYDNKTYNTTYTFLPSGKIQRIDATLDTTATHQ